MANTNIPAKVRRAASRFRKQRAAYYEWLAQMLESSKGGMKLLQLFENDVVRYPKDPRGVLAGYWVEQFNSNGANLAAAWQGTLPDDEVTIVRIAEESSSGTLTTALRDISRVAKLADKIKGAVFATLAAAFFGVSIGLVMFTVFPLISTAKLQELFSFIPLDQWGPKGQAFNSHAERIRSYGVFFVAVALAAIWYVVWTVNHLVGPTREWLDSKVVLYRIVRDIKGAMFMATMATLTRRRGNQMFTLKGSLEVFIQSARSPWLKWRVQQIVDKIDETGGVGADAFNTNLLNPEMFYFLRDMVEARSFAEGFEETGRYVESSLLDKTLKHMTVYRWVLLMSGVALTIFVVGWQFAVINEMTEVMQTYMSSR